jgi:hypothetical protein
VHFPEANATCDEATKEKDDMTYCKPTRDNVNNAMRVDSVRPLMEGVPTHDAA